MKKLVISMSLCSLLTLVATPALATPDGSVVIYNASNKNITAAVSNAGSFNLSANEQRDVSYDILSRACSDTPTSCTAHFYVDNVPAGTATINVQTGRVVRMSSFYQVRVRTGHGPQHELRTVVIR